MNTYLWVFLVFAGITLVALAGGWVLLQIFGPVPILAAIGIAGAVGLIAVIIEWITERSRA